MQRYAFNMKVKFEHYSYSMSSNHTISQKLHISLKGKVREKQFIFTCKIVKFSRTLFIMYFSGKCLSLWIKLIMYSHMGERWIL